MEDTGEVIIYQTPDGTVAIDVKIENDSVWLRQEQIAALFGRDRTVITRHINNIFKENELDKKCNVQNLHIPNSDRPVTLYNLDVIISIGYRVKSKHGVQFRIWANNVLKTHLIKGYTINERRLHDKSRELEELKKAVKLLGKISSTKDLS